MTDEVFHNASRTAIRIFLMIAAGLALVGVTPLGVAWALQPHDAATPANLQGWLLLCMLTAPLVLAMLFSALLTWPTARRVDREFDAFRRGELLARWEYAPEFWTPYVEAETRRIRNSAWVIYALVIGVIAAISACIGCAVVQTAVKRMEFLAILTAAVAVLSGAYYAAARGIINFRRRALLECPRAYIGSEAVYCGGIFNFWGSQMRALHSLRIIPGKTVGLPAVMEFVIGLSTGARNTASAVDALSMLAGRPAMVSNYSVRQVVPIPPAETVQAIEIVRRLRSPVSHVSEENEQLTPRPAGTAFSTVPVESVSDHVGSTLHGRHHDARSLGSSARRWFFTTLALLVGGLCLFLFAIRLDAGRAASVAPTTFVTLIEVAGLFAWVVSPATLVVAIVQFIRARRFPRTTQDPTPAG